MTSISRRRFLASAGTVALVGTAPGCVPVAAAVTIIVSLPWIEILNIVAMTLSIAAAALEIKALVDGTEKSHQIQLTPAQLQAIANGHATLIIKDKNGKEIHVTKIKP